MLAIIMIIGGTLLRLVPHIPNFAPITATSLFGGTYLSKKFAILVPLVAMILSDYLLSYLNGTTMFHSTTLYVWGSFLISSLIGIWLRNHRKLVYILGASLAASLQFFLITNFGVWAGGMYSRNLDGLVQSYIMGIPFFQWTILGDLFYTGIFFGSFELARRVVNKQRALTSEIL